MSVFQISVPKNMTLLTQIDFGALEATALPKLATASGGNLKLGFILSEILNYLYPIAGLCLLLYLIYGGIQLLTSTGDPKKVESAKDKITGALIGFVIIVAAFWITQIIASILGLSNFGDIF